MKLLGQAGVTEACAYTLEEGSIKVLKKSQDNLLIRVVILSFIHSPCLGPNIFPPPRLGTFDQLLRSQKNQE